MEEKEGIGELKAADSLDDAVSNWQKEMKDPTSQQFQTTTEQLSQTLELALQTVAKSAKQLLKKRAIEMAIPQTVELIRKLERAEKMDEEVAEKIVKEIELINARIAMSAEEQLRVDAMEAARALDAGEFTEAQRQKLVNDAKKIDVLCESDAVKGLEKQEIGDTKKMKMMIEGLVDACSPAPELEFDEQMERVREKIHRLKEALNEKDKDEAEKEEIEVRRAVKKLAELAEERSHRLNPQTKERVQRMKEATDHMLETLNQLRQTVNKPETLSKLEELQRAVEELDRLAETRGISLPEREKQELQKVVLNVMNKSPSLAVAAVKEAAALQQKINSTEPEMKQLEESLPLLIAATKEALKNPSRDTERELEDKVFEMKAQLSGLQASSLPQSSVEAQTLKAVNKASDLVMKLTRAAKANDSKGMQEAVNGLKNSSVPELEQLMTKWGDKAPKAMKQDLEVVKKLVAEAEKQPSPEEMKQIAEKLKNPLERMSDLCVNPLSDATVMKERLSDIAVAIRRNKSSAKSPKELLAGMMGAGKAVSDSLDELTKNLRMFAADGSGDMSERGKAALALDAMFRAIDSGSAAAGAIEDKLFDQIEDKQPQQQDSLPPKDFAQAITQVAKQIEVALKKEQSTSVTPNTEVFDTSVTSLAQQLQRMATAAKENQRQQMIVVGKGIYQCIGKLCEELRSTSKNCKDIVFQDKLIRASALMKDVSTQLKILSAVKAGTNMPDTDDQIVSLTRAMGQAVTQCLIDMSIVKKAGLIKH